MGLWFERLSCGELRWRYASVSAASHRANASVLWVLARPKQARWKGGLHFLHSVSAATSLSIRVASLKRFLWHSRTTSGSPPLSVRNRSKSSTIFPRAPSVERAWMGSRTDAATSRVARFRRSSDKKPQSQLEESDFASCLTLPRYDVIIVRYDVIILRMFLVILVNILRYGNILSRKVIILRKLLIIFEIQDFFDIQLWESFSFILAGTPYV